MRMGNGLLQLIKKIVPRPVKERFYFTRWYRYYARYNTRKQANLNRIADIIESLENLNLREYLKQTVPLGDPTKPIPVPREIVLEINNTCNIDCAMCRTSLSTRPKGLMDPDLFESITDKLSKLRINISSLHTIGEPLANRNLADYLKILRKKKLRVGFLSSNFLLGEKQLDTIFEFRDVIVSIRPSIDAASKPTYEKIRCGGKWEQFQRSLLAFSKRNAASSSPFPVSVHSIVSQDNFHELAFIPLVFSYLTGPENFSFGFINSLAPQNEYFLEKNYLDDFSLNMPCHQLWGGFHILRDGSISACCRDYHGELIFGTVHEDLESAYNNSILGKMRNASFEGLAQELPPACNTCYLVDPRLSDLLNAIFGYFFLIVRKHPAYLQNALHDIGKSMKTKDFRSIVAIVQSL
ncbi:putative Fe-S oxidoreductase [Desulfomonile tiedjei DSM 6799]|uniref:Putative Fe-S oxidoreductase n=1 Tax=Desulfomonile tiedjei (strain ATCC 49306 / DSM 6799 / DCB-1) TaxID=706587 RepID=I4C4D2_DESTA|nr:putative Fe-S oxidoreductase [Desulfomonile tiedjei DSM 6799]